MHHGSGECESGVLHMNQCEAFDFKDGYDYRLDDRNGQNLATDDDDWDRDNVDTRSMKVSGCGYNVDFYSDYLCLERLPRLSTY